MTVVKRVSAKARRGQQARGHCDVCRGRLPDDEALIGFRRLDGQPILLLAHAGCWASPRVAAVTEIDLRVLTSRVHG
jgi:hypothetical protein